MPNVTEFFLKGGIFMLPILASSILSLGFFIYKIRLLRDSQAMPELLQEHAFRLLRERRHDEAAAVCARYPSPLGRIVSAIIAERGKGRERMKEAAEASGKLEVVELERFNGAIGTIAGLGTLLGLLGTVFGLIRIFATIGSDPVINPTKLALGISEALNNTAFGLLVAIPSLIFYRILEGRLAVLAARLENAATEAVNAMSSEG